MKLKLKENEKVINKLIQELDKTKEECNNKIVEYFNNISISYEELKKDLEKEKKK